MGPLEAARKILDEGPLLGQTSDDYRSWYICVFCVAEQEWADDFPHKPDCPWKQMPKIVAALEVAERLKEQHDRGDYAEDLEGDLTELSAALKGKPA